MAQSIIAETTTTDPYGNEFFSINYNLRWILFTDGYSGLYAWDNSSSDAFKVIDYLPSQNMDSGVSTSNETKSWCESNTPAPSGKYLTKYKGRVFVVDQNTSKIYYSGTRTDQAIDGYTIHPWENWNVRQDLSRSNPANGASMIIGDQNQSINGIWGTPDGLLVFKDKSIYLWSWSDAAAPHQTDMGASIDRIADGIGLVSYNSICQDGNSIFFMGRDQYDNYGIYEFSSEGIKNISYKISAIVGEYEKVDITKKLPCATIYNGFYFLSTQVNGELKLVLAYSLEYGYFIIITGVNATGFTSNSSSGKMLTIGSDGKIYTFPNKGLYLDYGTNPIDWEIATGVITGDEPFIEKNYRLLMSNIDTILGDIVVDSETDVNTIVKYDDYEETFTRTISGNTKSTTPLCHRAEDVQLIFYGSADVGLRIKDIGIGWRNRNLHHG
jgi:hypothetical protein